MATFLRETAPDFRERVVTDRLPAEGFIAQELTAAPAAQRLAPQLAIVVPCFNEEEVLPETARRLGLLLDRLQRAQRIAAGSRIVFIDDGSRDRTWGLIEQLSRQDQRMGGIKLSRNRGHQNALLAGLFTVDGDVLVSVDADLQDDVEVIEEMLASTREG